VKPGTWRLYTLGRHHSLHRYSRGQFPVSSQHCYDCSGGDGGDPDDPNWCPAEVDSTLQSGDTWFYVEGLGIHPLSDLQVRIRGGGGGITKGKATHLT
jgi:hypothetical protein